MRQALLIVFNLLFIALSNAQLVEDFSDQELLNNPEWNGTHSDFIINATNQLQLNNSVSDTSWLSSALLSTTDMEWRFYLKMSFAPSSSNFARIYLWTDNKNLTQSLNGYFLQFGESGANDVIELFRQSGSTTTSIARGQTVIASAVEGKIKVLRTQAGQWTIYLDQNLDEEYELECSSIDSSSLTTGFFGLRFNYTSSNAKKFYLDDVYAGEVQTDQTVPTIETISFASATQLLIRCSEKLDPASVSSISNYSLSQYSGSILNACRDTLDHSAILLTLSNPLTRFQLYHLLMRNVEDLSGNRIDTIVQFKYFLPEKYDVLINELMVDPTPSNGLPEYEYIELFNATSEPVNIGGWQLCIGSGLKMIPGAVIPPNGYFILTNESAANEFALFNYVVAIPGLSTTALTNSGNMISLRTKEGALIHSVTYDQSSYHDENKKDGGWSMELIDQVNICLGNSNWKASNNSDGGTPGLPNSIMQNSSASSELRVEKFCIPGDTQLELSFSMLIDSVALTNTTAYTISGGIGSPVSAVCQGPSSQQVTLHLKEPLKGFEVYSIVINALHDCRMTPLSVTALNFSNYKPMQSDLIITEIMADPDPVVALPNIEYLEVLNRTNFPISLSGYSICAGTTCATIDCGTIQPGAYFILCDMEFETAMKRFGNVVGVENFPGLTNEGKIITLQNAEHEVISSVNYSSEWYNHTKKSEGGWSLELKDPGNPCAGKGNWSASIHPSGGTPSRENSIYSSYPDQNSPILKHVTVKDSVTLKVFFNESVQSTMVKPNSFHIDHEIGSPLQVSAGDLMNTSFNLSLRRSISDTKVYTLKISSINDCCGNPSREQEIKFGIPEPVQEGEIIFNEILADAASEGEEFIELYNRSGHIADLSTIYLADFDTASKLLSSYRTLDTSHIQILPGSYVAISNSTEELSRTYNCTDRRSLSNSFSDLSLSKEGSIALISNTEKLLDVLTYTEGMHYDLLDDTKGISLERISTSSDLWQSASENSGWATPGYRNSQAQENTASGGFSVYPEVFTPNNDGINDLLNISFLHDDPGSLANVFIFSSTGIPVRHLIKNELIGNESRWVWDGLSDSSEECVAGIYIVYFETFNHQGVVKKQKKVCVLGLGD